MVEQAEHYWKDTSFGHSPWENPLAWLVENDLTGVGEYTEGDCPKVKNALVYFCRSKDVYLINLFQKEIKEMIPFCYRGRSGGEMLHPIVVWSGVCYIYYRDIKRSL